MFDLEDLRRKAEAAPAWGVTKSIPQEGFECYWIKTQPSPMMRGFTHEIGLINGPQNDEQEAIAVYLDAVKSPVILSLLNYVKRLEEALKPFADIGQAFDNSDPKDSSVWAQTKDDAPVQIGASLRHGWFVTVRDLRRARTALEPT